MLKFVSCRMRNVKIGVMQVHSLEIGIGYLHSLCLFLIHIVKTFQDGVIMHKVMKLVLDLALINQIDASSCTWC